MNKLAGSDVDEAQLTCYFVSRTSLRLETLLMSERTFIVFIDYSKALDSVSHIQMFNMGFPRHIVEPIQALYEKQLAIARWDGSHTTPFFIEKGIRQGCSLYGHCSSVLTRST